MLRGVTWQYIYSFLLKILKLLIVLVGRIMVLSVHTSYTLEAVAQCPHMATGTYKRE